MTKKITLQDVDVSKVDLASVAQAGLNYTKEEMQSDEFKAGIMIGWGIHHMEEDETFAQEVSRAGSMEGVYKVFSKYMDIPFELFANAYAQLEEIAMKAMYADEEAGELSDDALDMVAGGSKAGWKKFTNSVKDMAFVVGGEALCVAGLAVAACTSGLAAPAGLWVASIGASFAAHHFDDCVFHETGFIK